MTPRNARALLVPLVLLPMASLRCGGGGGGGSAAIRDLAAPVSTLSYPGPIALVDEPSLAVSGGSADPSGVVAVDVDGVAAASTDDFATWSASRPLASGVSAVTVAATDRRGNRESRTTDATVTLVERLMVGPCEVVADGAGAALVVDFVERSLVSVDVKSGSRTVVSDPFLHPGPELVVATGLAADPTLALAWVSCFHNGDSTVVEVDVASGKRSVLSDASDPGPLLEIPIDVVADLTAKRLLVVDAGNESVIAVDVRTGARTLVSAAGDGKGVDPESTQAIAFDAVKRRLLVLDRGFPNGPALIEVDVGPGNRRLLSGRGVGGGPDFNSFVTAVTVSSDGTTAFVADFTPGRVLAVDLATGDRTVISDDGHGSGPTLGFLLDLDFDATTQEIVAVDAFSTGVFDVEPRLGGRRLFGRGPEVGAGPSLSQAGTLALDATRAWTVTTEGIVEVERATGARRLLAALDTSNDLVTLDAAGGRLLATASDALLSIDLATGTVAVVSDAAHGAGAPFELLLDVVVDPAGARAWVLDLHLDTITTRVIEVDLATGDRVVRSGDGQGGGPAFTVLRGMTLDAAGHRLLAGDESGSLFAIDVATGDRTELTIVPEAGQPPLAFPKELALSGDGRNLFAIASLEDPDLGLVTVVMRIDLEAASCALVTSTFAASRRLGPAISFLQGIAVDPATGALLVTDGVGHLLAVDVATGERAIVSR